MKQLSGRAECCWTATAPGTSYPRLQGRQRFDVVIVGGGIVGLTAALQLAWAGQKVAVVEALGFLDIAVTLDWGLAVGVDIRAIAVHRGTRDIQGYVALMLFRLITSSAQPRLILIQETGVSD